MNIKEAFPSKWLKADDIGSPGAPGVEYLIAGFTFEEMQGNNGKESKPVLWFRGEKKGLVLNKTNSDAIMAAYGAETDDWANQTLELFTLMVDAYGETKPGIRVRIPQAADPIDRQTGVGQEEPPEHGDDDHPFSP